MTVQNVIGSLPITNIQPPPEGLQAAVYPFTLTPSLFSFVENLNLSDQGGSLLSQVCAILVDNSQNAQAVTVIHGPFNEALTVAAYKQQTVPTFSVGSSFSFQVFTSVAPTVNLPINVTLFNYELKPSSIVSAHSPNASVPYAGLLTLTGTGTYTLLPSNNYGMSEFVIDVCAFGFTGPGGTIYNFQAYLACGSINIQSISLYGTNGNIFISNILFPLKWKGYFSAPLVLPRGNPLVIKVTSFTNLTSMYMNVNASAIVYP